MKRKIFFFVKKDFDLREVYMLGKVLFHEKVKERRIKVQVSKT